MKNNAIIGKNIKSYRIKLQLTQEEVAKFLGYSREYVSLLESGEREIDLKKLELLADLFGVELLNLLEENSELVSADLVFAYRSDEMRDYDIQQISEFRKIIRNYIKMKNILGK